MKAWLKGGLIGVFVYFIYIVIQFFIPVGPNISGSKGTLIFALGLGFGGFLFVIGLIIMFLIFFIIGAIIGWIVGKIKSKKQKNSSSIK